MGKGRISRRHHSNRELVPRPLGSTESPRPHSERPPPHEGTHGTQLRSCALWILTDYSISALEAGSDLLPKLGFCAGALRVTSRARMSSAGAALQKTSRPAAAFVKHGPFLQIV